ncbi:MAG: DUF1566 domain-containing protein [Candidatus Brocadiales bacterium]|nr:DUF1566 domain-containing protein [Candidatus Brocadiales bacterium]
MVRTFLLFACAVSLIFCITSYSCADLIDNGDGTITQIRSDGTKLMWTQDTLLAGDSRLPESKKNWNEAKLWAANLDFAGYSDWRLPRTPGTTTDGITTEGELGDLYHAELGNLRNPDIFNMSDTHSNVFWTETELDASTVFIVNFGNFKGKYSNSYQQTCSAEDNRQAWAVRDVTASVSETEDVAITETTRAAESTVDTEVTADTKVTEVATATENAEITEAVKIIEETVVNTDAKATAGAEVAEVATDTKDIPAAEAAKAP